MTRDKPSDFALALDVLILALALVLANARGIIFYFRFPDLSFPSGVAWREALLWIITTGLMALAISRHGLASQYRAAWRRQPVLIIFVLFAGISLAWSVFFAAGLHRYVGFLCTTLIAVYFAIRYGGEEWLEMMFWLGAVILIVCLAMALLIPELGTQPGYPYYGAWRGIFKHKIHLGQMMAFLSAVFALRALARLRDRNKLAIVDGVIYLLSLLLVVKSKSAGGQLTALVLNGIIVIFWLWLRFRLRLKAWHYWAIVSVALVGVMLLLVNLNAFLGIFGRDSSLTGRIPLWQILIRDHLSARPVGGYGYGSLWSVRLFQITVQHQVGWDRPLGTGDSGFIDMLLQLGVVGLGLFLILLVQAGIRAARLALANGTLEALFPALCVVFVLVANISYSLTFEAETFSWLLFVVALVMASPKTAKGTALRSEPSPPEEGSR